MNIAQFQVAEFLTGFPIGLGAAAPDEKPSAAAEARRLFST